MNRLVFDSRGLSASREYFLLKRPQSLAIAVWIYLALLVGSLLWASLYSMEDVVRGPIQVHPTDARSTVRNPVAGTVIAVTFVNHSPVSRGDLLYRVDDREIRNKLHSLSRQIDLLAAEIGALETMGTLLSEVQERATVGVADRSMRAHLVEHLLTELSRSEPEHGMTPSVNARWEAFAFDDRQLLSAVLDTYVQLESKRALPASMTTVSEIRTLELKAQMGVSEWLANRKRTTAMVHADRTEKLAALNDLLGQRTTLQIARERCTVRAPISGTIFADREVNGGDRLAQDEPVLTIVPDSRGAYQGTIRVDAHQMSGLSVGSSVRVAFDSLPPSEFGFAAGTITRIPPDLSIVDNSRSVFLIEAELPDRLTSRRSGLVVQLHPGLQGEARIVRRTKPVLAFILELLDFRQ